MAQSYIEDNPAALSRLREALVRAFARLEQPYRRAIELYCLEDAGDQKTCAKIVGVSECTFAQNISRGRLKLALHLQQELEDGDDPEKLRGDHETPNSR